MYRVTVRGRFHQLSERARTQLVRELPEHDIFKSSYSPEGTFTYDASILFFNLRYEIRTDEGGEAAGAMGIQEADSFLRTLDYGYEKLKVNVVDTSAMWKQ